MFRPLPYFYANGPRFPQMHGGKQTLQPAAGPWCARLVHWKRLMGQPEYLQFGGMAVPEGVMMRSPNYYSVACRAPNGEIIVKTEPLDKTFLGKLNWLKKPFLRGTLALLDTMAIGVRAMRFASDIQLDARYAKPGEEVVAQKSNKTLDTAAIAGTIIFSLAFGFFLFNVVPNGIAQFLGGDRAGADTRGLVTNYIAEVVKLVFFLGYLFLIRLLPPILDVFRYHGAEHKAINSIENIGSVTAESAMAQTRLHPRCGTNFAIMVFIIGFLLNPLVPRYWLVGPEVPVLATLVRVVTELALLPLIAGISYEMIRAAGRAKNQRWVNIMLAPGLWTQFITTEEPKEPHIEVAIRSLDAVMRAEETGEMENTVSDIEPAVPTSGESPTV